MLKRWRKTDGSAAAENVQLLQGFVCPICLSHLASPEALQQHYADSHDQSTADRNNGDPKRQIVDPQSSSNSEIDSTSSTSSSDDNNPAPHDPQNRPLPPGLQQKSSPPPGSQTTHRPVGGDEDSSSSTLSSGSFVCPQCMLTCASPESLQAHFESLHGSILATEDTATCDLINACDSFAFENELKNAKASLLAERNYNAELRKEFQKLQSTFLNHQQKSENLAANTEEIGYYLQQIQALEAGKALITGQLLEQEKIVAELLRDLESLRKEKDFIVSKTIKMSKDTAGMKARWDEETEQKLALGEECVSLRDRVNSLQRTLDQRPSDDDVSVLQQELVNAQRAMDELTREREQELVNLRSQMMLIQDRCTEQEVLITSLTEQLSQGEVEVEQIQRQADNAVSHGIPSNSTHLESEVARLNQELQQSQKNLSEKSDHLTTKHSEVSSLNEAMASVNSDLSDLKSQLFKLTSLNESAEKQIVQLTEERDSARLSLEESRFDSDKLEKSLKSSESSLASKSESLATSLKTLEAQLAERTTTMEAKQEELVALNQKLKELQTELGQSKHEVEKAQLARESAETQAAQMKQERDASQENMKELLSSQANSLEAKLNETVTTLQAKMEQLSNDLVEKEKTILSKNEQLKVLETELQSSKDQVEKISAELKKKESELKDVKEEMLKKLEKLQNDIDSITAEKSQLEIDLSAREKELLSLRTQMTSTIDGLNIKLSKQTEDLAQEKQRNDELESAKTEQTHQWKVKFNTVTSELDKEKDAVVELSSTVGRLESELQEAICSRDIQLKENDGLHKSHEAAIKEKDFVIEEKINEISKLASEKDGLSVTIDGLTQELVNVKSDRDSSRKEAGEIKSQIPVLEDVIAKSKVELETLKAELVQKQRELDDATEQAGETKAELVGVELDVTRMKAELEAEKCATQTKLNLAEADKSQLQSHNEDLIAQLATLNAEITKVQEESCLVTKQKEAERADLEDKAAELQKKLDTASANCVQLTEKHRLREEDLEDQLSTLGGSLAGLRVELAEAKAASALMAAERQGLEDQIAGLTSQISAFHEEKKSLLQRCLSLERDVDEERDNMQEVRRRHEDALAAMHELGRENQSLQIDMSKHFHRRWADDAEVHNCACGKPFSVTVRKHHCRNCGLIFCNECSEKLAFVASSKKKVRVCDNCYKDIAAR